MLRSNLYNKRAIRRALGYALCILVIPVLALLIVASMIPSNEGTTAFLLTIDGSELITPVTKRIAQEFVIRNPHVNIAIAGNGTRHGFERFCNSEIHINEALLPIRYVDNELCRQKGTNWIQLPIAWEGFGNYVSIHNDFVECLTAELNRQIWRPTEGAHTWNELNSQWPDEPIHRYAQINERGSPVFVDDPSYEDAEELERFDVAMVDNLAVDPFGIGVFSVAYYSQYKDEIRPVSVYENGECVSPDPLTVEPGQPPVWGRVVNIYVNQQALRDYQILQEFLDFYMMEALTVTRETGFFALSPEEYEDNRDLIHSNASVP